MADEKWRQREEEEEEGIFDMSEAPQEPNYIFFGACKAGDVATIRRMLKEGQANVNMRDRFDNTPLLLAAQNGKREACALLLEAGADPDAANKWGTKPKQVAGAQLTRLLTAFKTGVGHASIAREHRKP